MVSDGGLGCNPLDSRFRGNDGGGWGARGRLRVFVRIRIFRIGGIFRISLSPKFRFSL